MIRGYVDVISSDSPLTPVPVSTTFYRKTVVKMSVRNFKFFIDIQGTGYSFEVGQNIRNVYEDQIGSGLVRIGFVRPQVDLVISCTCSEIKEFLKVVEFLKELPVDIKLSESLDYGRYGTINQEGSFDYEYLKSGSYAGPHTVMLHREHEIPLTGQNVRIFQEVTLKSYPFLRVIQVKGIGLIDVPNTLGLLPCLKTLDLGNNLLGFAVSWEWLNSPNMRENLISLHLDQNNLSRLPEPIVKLRNLEMLFLSNNDLISLPETLGNLKHLSTLHVCNNELKVLPGCLFRKDVRLFILYIRGNPFIDAATVKNNRSHLHPKDFGTITVPSLFQTAAKLIITEGFGFLEYNIPKKLADYLEGAYICQCGSVVFCDNIGRVEYCWIDTKRITVICDERRVPITINCCSYACYMQL